MIKKHLHKQGHKKGTSEGPILGQRHAAVKVDHGLRSSGPSIIRDP